MKNKKVLLLTAGVFLSPQLLASPVLTEWGTIATVVSGVCSGDTCTPDDVLGDPAGITVESTVNGPNQVSSATGPVSITQGTAQSSSEITGGLATPTLKVKASSTADSWIAAGAYAIQGYEYTGIGDTVSFDINFDGMLTNPDSDTATGFAGGMYLLSAEQMLAAQEPLALLLGPDFSIFSDSSIFLAALELGTSFLGSDQMYEFEVHEGDATGAVDVSGLISIDLMDGDQFYLMSSVLASAGGSGASADAYSTFTAAVNPGFNGQLDPVGVAAVPEPTTIWLVMSGLIGLIGVKRTHTV